MQLWKLETGNWLDAACEERNGNGKLEMRWMEMWLCGEAATWETGNWKLGADLKRISFVKNVEEAPGRFRSVDLVQYIKIGSSQCAAICVLESRNLETQKRFDLWDFTNPQTVAKGGSRKPGNSESSPRPQQSRPSPALAAALRSPSHRSRCARCAVQ